MVGSIRFNDTQIDETTNFDILVTSQLTTGFLGGGEMPVDGLSTLYDRLRDTPFFERLSAAIAKALEHVSPETRARTLLFYERQPSAQGVQRIAELALDDPRHLFHGVRDPLQAGQDLAARLRHTLGALVRAGDPVIRDAARTLALRPAEAADVAAALARWDRAWLLEHLGAIAQAAPDAIDPILYNVRFSDDADPDDWLEVVQRLASLGFSQDAIIALAPLTLGVEPGRSAVTAALRGAHGTNGKN